MLRKSSSRGGSAKNLIPIVLILVSLFVISISSKTIVKFPTNAAAFFLGNLQKAFYAVKGGVDNSILAIGELRNLRMQYEALTKKLEKYSEMQREYADVLSENARLKEQLGFAQNVPSIKVAAQIIAEDPGNVYTTFVINKGSNSGVIRDMPVVAFQGGTECLVGKILEVRSGTSVILPVYDRQFYVAARLARTRAEGLVEGEGKSSSDLSMSYISRLSSQEIQKGDVVVTSGLDSIFPPDLAIGRVTKISLPDYASSATLLVEPTLRFDKLEYVFLLDSVAPVVSIAPQGAVTR